MHVCINCGSDKVERQGDDFTCHKCQFHWDVAFEQANQVYLRSQGRQPAKPIVETVAEGEKLTATPSQAAPPAALPTDQQALATQADTLSDVPTPETTAGDGQSPFPKPSGKGKKDT